MPLCYCYTSLPNTAIPEGFEEKFAQCIHEVLPNKPIERISVIVVPGARICKAGSTDPAMLIQMRAIGVFNADDNPKYFPKFFKFLTDALNLPEKRFTIEFVDIQGTNAKNGQ